MFQEKEILEYGNTKAPEELKNRTWSSIKKQRQQRLSIAACIAVVFLAGNVMYQNSAIVKVKDVPFSISESRNQKNQSEIPMEISVSENAHIEVSEGTIRIEDSSEDSYVEATELDICEDVVVIWNMEGVKESTAICTITTETKVYQYVAEAEETGWKLRLKEK